VLSVAIGNIVGNADLEIVTGRQNGTIALFVKDAASPTGYTRSVINSQSVQVRSIGIADFNGDTLPDLVTASSGDNRIAWYRQNLVGGFERITLTTAALDARSVAVGDVNNDGAPDIVSASFQDGQVRLFRNDLAGLGIFVEQPPIGTASGTSSVHLADIDGDGLLDVLATARFDRQVIWYKNQGGLIPTFSAPMPVLGSNLRFDSAVTGDVDGDGLLDIVAAASADNTIKWFKNTGGSPPQYAEQPVTTGIGTPNALLVIDLDEDGHTDILATGLAEDALIWYQNNGEPAPTFTARVVRSDLDGAIGIAAGDLTGNGAQDVASVATFDNKLMIHNQPRVLNQTTGLGYPLISRALLAANPGDVLLADEKLFDDSCETSLNFFGRPVVLRSTGAILRSALTSTVLADGAVLESAPGTPVTVFGTLSVPANAHTSVIGDEVSIAGPVTVGANATLDAGPVAELISSANLTERFVTDQADGVWSVRAGDLDGDGDLDLVSADQFANRVTWYENDGFLNPAFTRRQINITVQGPRSVHLADLNNDTRLDILVASFDDNSVRWLENIAGPVPTFVERTLTTTATGARSVYAADLTGNGWLDVVAASSDNNSVVWFKNNQGSFDPPRTVTDQASGAASVHTDDINGDGLVDLVVAIRLSNEVAWYQNSGGDTPTFTKRVVALNQSRVEFVTTADLNNDGAVDIVSAPTTADKISWFANNGGQNPSFIEYTLDGFVERPVALAVGDLNQDGRIDVAASSSFEDRTYWYENNGASIPSFTRTAISSDRRRSRTVDFGDLDGDGDPDIVAGSTVDDLVYWYQSALITDLVLDRANSGIESPSELTLRNKSVRIEASAHLGSGTILGIDGVSSVSGHGRLEAPLVSVGGLLGPTPGETLSVQGNFLNSFTGPVGGREAGMLRIGIIEEAVPTRLAVSGVAGLGGGLEVSVAAGVVPVAGQPLPPLLTASSLDPQVPRFDVVFAPLLTVSGSSGPVQGTLIASYSDPGETGSVSMVPITLEDLLFTTNPFETEGTPNDAVIADITGGPDGDPDGIPDLVIAIPFIEGVAPEGAVALLIGNSDGGFGFDSPILYTSPFVDAPIAVEVGDFRSSGRLEIAYANRGEQSGDNSFLVANSSAPQVLTGSNLDPLPIPAGMRVTDMAVGDILQGELERTDLMYGARGSGGAILRLSEVMGGTPQWETQPVDVDDIDTLVPFHRSLPSAFGQNGLAATNPTNNTVRVFKIDFGQVDDATFVDIQTGFRPGQVVAAYLDSDIYTDLAVLAEGNTDNRPGVISLIRGEPNGFAGSVDVSLTDDPAVSPRPTSIALADLDNDGDLDIAIASVNEQGTRAVRQLRNTSTDAGATGLSFAAASDIDDQPAGTPLIVLAADLDSNNAGDPDDLVVLVDPNAEVRGAGMGGNTIRLSVPPGDCIADFNDSGTIDFFDLVDFISAFNNSDPDADLADPPGVWNFFDLAAFIDLFIAGCD
jgi:hypothetical protein